MKKEFLDLISQVEYISTCYSVDGLRKRFINNATFLTWDQGVQLELQEIYDQTKDKFIGDTLELIQKGFNGWNDERSFNKLRGSLLAIKKNIDKYYVNTIPKIERNETQKLNKIFIVHGHDDAAKSEMARTLEKASFEAIILHEQASAGKTVIEKIEANTDVAFAVVLYTPCDVGRTKEEMVDQERSRARQNVVFEHGYLIGKLGREYVCALVKGKTETPGDIDGVVYIPMDDAGAWKMALAKEMKSAGLSVDLNRFYS
ncbi:MAG: TIR domain-containing protein [bacterium]